MKGDRHTNAGSLERRAKTKSLCCVSPPKSTNEAAALLERAERNRVAWRRKQWRSQKADPNLSPSLTHAFATRISAAQLLASGIDLVPSISDFPTGTRPEDLANYPSIVRAFSRTFDPRLFSELSIADPFPLGEPYWSNFFFQIATNTQNGLLRVNVSKGPSPLCLGVTGQYQKGGPMSLYDCSAETDVFHEIGHALMDDGILKGIAPVYFNYTSGSAVPAGGQPQLIDARVWLNTWFGKKHLDTGVDIDGVDIGFVSAYASPGSHAAIAAAREDFAETFMHYVYRPSILFDKVVRQSAQGSQTLSMKVGLIAHLYAGMWFTDGGIPGGWPGFSV